MFLILLTFVPVFSRERAIQLEETERALDLDCTDLTDKIDKANYFGHGFKQNITLPSLIAGRSYTLLVTNETVFCKTDNVELIRFFTARNITNGTHFPPFYLKKGNLRVFNVVQTVTIS